VAPRNSTRSWGLKERRIEPDFASATGWCPPQRRVSVDFALTAAFRVEARRFRVDLRSPPDVRVKDVVGRHGPSALARSGSGLKLT